MNGRFYNEIPDFFETAFILSYTYEKARLLESIADFSGTCFTKITAYLSLSPWKTAGVRALCNPKGAHGVPPLEIGVATTIKNPSF